jgi:hypothetical protein
LNTHGTFYLLNASTSSIIDTNVTAGNVHFTSSFGTAYTASLIVSASSNMTDLSGSITYPLIIHPYYTSSIYTASVVVNYTKVLEGAPPIQIVISPIAASLTADEVGFVTPVGYSAANTTIQVKEGDDFLKLTTTESFANADARKGTYTINSITASNIQVVKIASSSLSGLTGTVTYNRFDYPYVSASALYTIQVYPFALGAGHQPTSSIFTRTQTFIKNVAAANARSLDFKASSYTINYNRDGNRIAPLESIDLTVTAFNTTGSYVAGQTTGPQAYLYYVEPDGTETFYDGPQPMESIPPAYSFTGISGPDAAGPGENKTWKVKITDGKAPAFNLLQPSDIRAEAQLTIAGVKAGNDAYKLVASNESTSITANLWTSSLDGTGMKITTFKGVTQLINVHPYPAPDGQNDYDYQNEVIGVLGYSSASIFSKSAWITPASNKFPTSNPASIGDISDWTAPGTNTTGEIVYKVDFENNEEYGRTQTQFVTQSFAVQFTNPAPYIVNLTNENSSAVYKVSGQFTTAGTGTSIRAYRGEVELSNTSSLLGNSKVDAYGVIGYPSRCRVSVLSKSAWLTLGGGLVPGSFVTGNPATVPAIAAWSSPETNTVGQVVYQIDCEYTGSNNNIPKQTIYKTQSLSIQQEGSTGPGIVMRGEWSNLIDYSGSVETNNSRRDAVIYGTSPTTYYAAISGSGPTTYDRNNVFVAAHAPTAGTDNAWWQYLGEEEFFVAAKIAIFEESFVKNTINVGNNPGSAYANIVLAGGRNDPYMAIGQYASIGYGNQGIWQGIYDLGGGSYMPRMSMVNSDNSRYLKWTGTGLEIRGDITVTGGDAATQGFATNAAATAYNNAVTAANGYTGTAITLLSGSLGALAAISQINSGSAATYIGPGSIVTNMVATNLILSTNYSASVEAGNFSDSGTFLNLANGAITTPGFALKSNGQAFFKGTLNSSEATFGAWTLNAQAFYITANSRIKLDAAEEQIQVLDENGAVRFTANTELTLPNPAGVQATDGTPGFPTGGTTTPLVITPTSATVVSETSTNGNNNFFYTGVYHELGSFISSANGGQHNVRYTWNPASAYSSGVVEAAGNAYSSLGVSLVLTPDATNDIVAYGTSDSAYAYGQMLGDDYYGGGFGTSGFGFGGYYAQQNYDTLTDPKTYTVSATLTASTRYRVKLLVSYTLSVDDTSGSPFFESSYASLNYQEDGASGRLVVEAVSAGTIVNGGGFQTAAGAGKFLKHATNPDVTGIYTYAEGGLMADKYYHNNVGSSIGYDVGGYPVIKGYGRWTMVNVTTGTPATPSVQTLGGCITSLAGVAQGSYTVNYALTNSAGGLSTITPSIFVFGTRDGASQSECTFDSGKFSGDSTFTNFRTQDNNVDTLNNMDELSIIVVM